MIWQGMSERLALLELLVRGRLPLRRSQAKVWEALAELPWTKLTGRRDELGINESRRRDVVDLIDRVWPTWDAGLAELTSCGLPPTPEGWAALEDAQRAAGLPDLPEQLNRRTAAALVAPHSKGRLTKRRLAALGNTELTHDGSVRIRVPKDVVAQTPQGVLELAPISTMLGEVSLPERALKGGLQLEGAFHAALLVENLGVFRDLSVLDGWIFVHVPGWDTATTRLLLERLAHVPVVHFGDLDPNGVRVFQHLRRQQPGLRWFVPLFWEDFIETRGRPTSWPHDLDLQDAPGLVQRLAKRGLWLEQEPLAVDARTPAALSAML